MKSKRLLTTLSTSLIASVSVNAFAFTSNTLLAPPISFAQRNSYPSQQLQTPIRNHHDFQKKVLHDSSSSHHDNELSPKKRDITLNLVSKIFNRLTDTMTPAGFGNDVDCEKDKNRLMFNIWGGGPKRMFIVFTCLMTWKYIRAKFLLKQKFTDKQPAWGHVITSADQEEVLHAWTCKNCGTTMFIAKGREIRFFNRFVECYNCGAKGKDSFYDRRSEILENDDTDFTYENPMDYVSKGERKKMEKELAQQKQAAATTVEVVEKVATEEIEEDSPVPDDTAPVSVAIKEEEEEDVPVPNTNSIKDIPSKPTTGSDDLDVLGMDI